MNKKMTRTTDDDERDLWEASRNYMNGNLSYEELEEVERPHVQNLKQALLIHVKRKHVKFDFVRQSSPDERERYLWMASRLYMSGEIGVEKLEEIETPHKKDLQRAIISFAKRKVRWHLLELLKISRDRRATFLTF